MDVFTLDSYDRLLLAIASHTKMLIASETPTSGLQTMDRCEAMADAGLLLRTGTEGELHLYEVTERGINSLRTAPQTGTA